MANCIHLQLSSPAHEAGLRLCPRSFSSLEATSSSLQGDDVAGNFQPQSRRVRRMRDKLAARSAAREATCSTGVQDQVFSGDRWRRHRNQSEGGSVSQAVGKAWWENGASMEGAMSAFLAPVQGNPPSVRDFHSVSEGLSGSGRREMLLEESVTGGAAELALESETATWVEHKVHLAPAVRPRDAGVPVYIMCPLDTVTIANTLTRQRALRASLSALRSAGVDGVMMDVWWGIVEREGPLSYDWAAYRELVNMVHESGLKLQAVMSFHQCGGNVGDHCTIPLPPWVLKEMEADPDLMYTDKAGRRNTEYISLGCDLLPVLAGRTPLQVYADFMRAFRDEFREFLGEVITEIQVGMGPAGELRYPAYPESNDKWRFPGIGEFQCYDSYMLASLRAAAEAAGKPHWGFGGPHDAGYYNQWPNETGFFHTNGSWNHPYGQFFLQWYSESLERHGDRILASAASIFREFETTVSGKVAGIHWHYRTASHAAELTAGYYNTAHRDGYLPLARMFARHGAVLNFTCIEMRDAEQPLCAMCSPEGLLRQVVHAAKVAGVRVAGENALPRFDEAAHEQIVWKSRLQLEGAEMEEPMCCFTFLRMSERLFRPDNWRNFLLFVRHMREGRTFLPWERQGDHLHHHLMQPSFLGPLHEAAEALMLQS